MRNREHVESNKQMSRITDDIAEKNRLYRENLDKLRRQLAQDFRAGENEAAADAMDVDDDLGLTTIFYIMFTSCGIVDFSKPEPALVKNCKAAYELWDKKHLCLASAEDLMAAVAVGYVDNPHSTVLCAPGVLSDADLALFNKAFSVVYSDHAASAFSYGTLGRYPLVPMPDWAYYVMCQNTLDLLCQDVLNERNVLCVYDMPHAMLSEGKRPSIAHAVVLELCLGVQLPDKMRYRPASMNSVDGWKVKAISSRFVISPDADEDMAHVYDIYRLWDETCKRLSIASIASMNELDDTDLLCENIRTLGDVLGMDSIIDAYMEGVPIEDLLA